MRPSAHEVFIFILVTFGLILRLLLPNGAHLWDPKILYAAGYGDLCRFPEAHRETSRLSPGTYLISRISTFSINPRTRKCVIIGPVWMADRGVQYPTTAGVWANPVGQLCFLVILLSQLHNDARALQGGGLRRGAMDSARGVSLGTGIAFRV